MKTAIQIIIFLIVCALIANVEISFNPFRIRAHDWEKLVGYFLLLLAFFFLNFQAHKSGYEKGWKDGSDCVLKILKEQSEKNNEQKCITSKNDNYETENQNHARN